jgi:RNA polymerase sigma-70 factor (ECF subfamily)
MDSTTDLFTEYYQQHINEIYRYVYFSVRQHRETAEDLTATVFTKAWQARNAFTPERSAFRTFLFRIARNTVIDHYRTHREVADLETANERGGHAQAPEQTDAALFWKHAAATLQPDAYEILILKYRSELSIEEIADTTGRSVNAVKSLLKRSRAMLSEHFTS